MMTEDGGNVAPHMILDILLYIKEIIKYSNKTVTMCTLYKSTFVTGFWKTDHIVMRKLNRISMSMLM